MQNRTEICLDFRANSTAIDPSYSDNATRMQGLIEFLRDIRQDSTVNIIGVSFYGAASPEGSDQLNRKLAVFTTYKSDSPIAIIPDTVAEPAEVSEPIINIVEPDTATVIETVVTDQQGWPRKLYLKTNTLGLAMGIGNAATELDLANHWSFSLPICYSAWNYFTTTIKFRTFAIQPELRYWLSEENDGFFVGAHFGLAYYNLAINGDYRYQDHNCESPAIGGGLSVGYRLPISKNNRWKAEFSLGAGVYPLYYDKFHNTPNIKDGLMIESGVKKIYWGIDQATVSFSYMLDLKKKGGKR